MTTLSHKIDFAIIFSVNHANPNGDPLNGNRPRTDYDGFGEVTDVCLKRKIRDRLQTEGKAIFVQSDEKKTDGMTSLKNRAESAEYGLGKEAFSFDGKDNTPDKIKEKACEKWFDVRTFGQVFAWKTEKKKVKKVKKGQQSDIEEIASNGEAKEESESVSGDGVSIAIRGPVTIQSAFSVEPVSITSTQITKSVSGEGDGTKKGSDTMGMKHRVDHAIYVTYGAITPQLADKTGFSDDDAESIKAILPKLFEGDASSARPEGSMAVKKVIWWQHNSKAGQYSSANVHGSLTVNADGSYTLTDLLNLQPEIIDGF
jgi:CRISPR-associated protein Csd2